jgi:hypothetical protein
MMAYKFKRAIRMSNHALFQMKFAEEDLEIETQKVQQYHSMVEMYKNDKDVEYDTLLELNCNLAKLVAKMYDAETMYLRAYRNHQNARNYKFLLLQKLKV